LKKKSAANKKLALIEYFRQTLKDIEWKEYKDDQERSIKTRQHEEFLEKLDEEKLYKQLLFAAEKQIEQDERIRK
jgi:hypothetical protein